MLKSGEMTFAQEVIAKKTNAAIQNGPRNADLAAVVPAVAVLGGLTSTDTGRV
jgi:hypothetical protein